MTTKYSLLLLAAICLFPNRITAQQIDQVFYLPSVMTPADVKAAKAAFRRGTIVAAELPNAARFASMFNVALPPSTSRHRTKPPCLMAVKQMPSGQVRTFRGSNAGWRPAVTAACRSSFQQWVARQSLLEDGILPGWTLVTEIAPGPQTTTLGNQVEITGSIYRANSTDIQNDYYLVTISGLATPVGGYRLEALEIQTSATGLGGVVYPVIEYGPSAGSTSFTLGANLPYSSGVVGAYARSSLATPDAAGIAQLGCDWLYASANSVDLAFIVKAPAGTSHFTLITGVAAAFTNSQKADVASYRPLFSVSAPSLSVPAVTYTVPGNRATINLQASRYLTWQITGTPTFAEAETSQGRGQASILFDVDSSAPPGTSSAFSFDTLPPSATSQVALLPLSTAVYVEQSLPKSGVLLAGGQDWNGNVLNTAQVWDPTTGILDPTNKPMIAARQSHSGTLILGGQKNGQVLVAGGFGADGKALSSTELFDPNTGQFTAGPTMTHPHAAHSAIRMNDGRILIIGGADETNNSTTVVDVYNPVFNTFDNPLQLVRARQNFTTSLLPDGGVLVAGGTDSLNSINTFGDAEIYDPSAGDQSFGPSPSGLAVPRQAHAAVQLASGQTLLLGGFTNTCSPCDPLTNGELFTPESSDSAQAFSPVNGTLGPGRRYPAAVHYPFSGSENEQVLIFGGFNYADWVASYEPDGESFTNIAPMQEQRDRPTAVLLNHTGGIYDSQILVAGGVLGGTGNSNGQRLEVYNPAAQTFTSVGMLNSARSRLTTTLFGLSTASLPAAKQTSVSNKQ